MIEISLSTNINAPADQVWKVVGGFNDLPKWHPAVENSELADDGKTRKLSLIGGGKLVEELVDPERVAFPASFVLSPLLKVLYPLVWAVNGIANGLLRVFGIRVEDAGNGSKLTWSGKFEPVGDPMAARSAIEGVYQAGLDNITNVLK